MPLWLWSSAIITIFIAFIVGIRRMASSAVIDVTPIDAGSPPFPTADPFLFLVYHRDDYPAGDERMQAPKIGSGHDFDPNQPYRMYHGQRIPGFPQHPHRGFETLTATLEGVVDHTDSLGGAGRYGNGDLQWLTAGRGIIHGENFPLVHRDRPNPLRLFQIWLNLPRRDKMADPTQIMFWSEQIPKRVSDGATLTVFAGQFGELRTPDAPPHSWASDPANKVAVWHLQIAPGGFIDLPATDADITRLLYFLEGDQIEIGGRTVATHAYIQLRSEQGVRVRNTGSKDVQALVLQGRPIREPVRQRGPFVMTTDEEVEQAFKDYRQTSFGGWPWDQDAVIFPAAEGRFVLTDGKRQTPPSVK